MLHTLVYEHDDPYLRSLPRMRDWAAHAITGCGRKAWPIERRDLQRSWPRSSSQKAKIGKFSHLSDTVMIGALRYDAQISRFGGFCTDRQTDNQRPCALLQLRGRARGAGHARKPRNARAPNMQCMRPAMHEYKRDAPAIKRADLLLRVMGL